MFWSIECRHRPALLAVLATVVPLDIGCQQDPESPAVAVVAKLPESGGGDFVTLNRQRLARSLLLITTSSRPRLAPLHPAAGAMFEFLARLPPREAADPPLRLEQINGQLRLRSGDGTESHDVPAELAALLRGLSELATREAEAESHPIETGELVAAFTSPPGQSTVLREFETILQAPALGDRATGGPTWFETGGLVFLSGAASLSLNLFRLDDDVHLLADELSRSRSDRQALEDLRRSEPIRFRALDGNGLLTANLDRSRGKPETDRSRALLGRVVDTLLQNVASSYMFDRGALLEALVDGRLPEGRYVGLWHSHPGYPSGAPPSTDDLEVARQQGRFIALVFRPDGYDVYDLRGDREPPREPLEPDVRVRPDGWRARFDALVTVVH